MNKSVCYSSLSHKWTNKYYINWDLLEISTKKKIGSLSGIYI